ncbi:DUF4097 family beta strand repeat-containing protein [Nonomuraea cavernae]|uniref:DUF4097 family beta strand repeat-containing protein n=1 Tax=Nonomuraea cavernae TaxID=2045107 RepID=UPI0033F4FA5B
MASAVLVALGMAGGCGLDAEEVHDGRTFQHSGDRLTIASSLGGLRVLPGTGTEIRVDRWAKGKAAQEGNTSWSLRDGTLRLSADCTMIVGDCGARYHVRVPSGTRLVIEASEGVVLDGLPQDIDVSASGPIRAYGTSGRLRLLVEDSVIAGDRLKSPSVRVRTASGSINLSFAVPPSKVDAVSREGRVTATVPDGAYRVTAKSTHGKVRSQLKNTKSDNAVIAKSTSGDVRIIAK